MSNLLVVDVFESYYEGRKTPFPAEGADAAAGGEHKPQGKGAKPEQPVKQAA